jgi:hypothetical protein
VLCGHHEGNGGSEEEDVEDECKPKIMLSFSEMCTAF